ncbi:hypothetical protein LNKW23_33040 [Paralimibaculum aggregatum]|uniref:Uncharacterized protein n=1 Tax=Paralimibaculum aggregatum TaxID=3036245 RepID=A0ABQ6LLL8_9RHOB|nr:hypothetical protein [Limibaculum sp. NKW23]GMG84090.1 hypothetical protein LNKW23_33040 [Limibaculum sp. NKW23]
MSRSSDVAIAHWRGKWTWRRVPGRVARGLAAAALAAAGFFVMHVGGWGLLPRFGAVLVWQGLLVGLPVALILAFAVVAPLLARIARQGPVTRARATRFGAATYGGVVFLWMALLQAGPPGAAVLWLLERGMAPETVELLALPYRHLLTPAVFALYGALAGRFGWWVAFGPARAATGEAAQVQAAAGQAATGEARP